MRAGRLDFGAPDLDRFPCLRLAYRALRDGATHAVALNAANEVAVASFLEGRLGFTAIPAVIERVMNDHTPVPVSSVETVRRVDAWARGHAAVVAGELELHI